MKVNNQSNVDIILYYGKKSGEWENMGKISKGNNISLPINSVHFHNQEWKVISTKDPSKVYTWILDNKGVMSGIFYTVDIYNIYNASYQGIITKKVSTSQKLRLEVTNQTEEVIDVFFLWEGKWEKTTNISPGSSRAITTYHKQKYCAKIGGDIVFQWIMSEKDKNYNVTITRSDRDITTTREEPATVQTLRQDPSIHQTPRQEPATVQTS